MDPPARCRAQDPPSCSWSCNPQEKQRIRRRHHGYAYLLAVVATAVLVQPLALNWPLLTSSIRSSWRW